MQNKKAIIIGSGVAGLAVAIRLRLQGFDVDVYEKNSYPGGKLNAFEKEGFQFDAGPSLFTQPQNIEELFSLANEPIEKYFLYQPVNIACKYFYENGKVVQAYTDVDAFAKELQEQLNEKPETVKDYLYQSTKLYNRLGKIFLNFSLHKPSTWFHKRIIKALGAVKFSYLFKTLHQHNKNHFSSKEAVQLFNRFATYNGSNPYKAPGMLSLIPHLEMNIGTFYPKGGMISITNALFALANTKGVKFHFNCSVEQIAYSGKKVTGVVVNSETRSADVVVSNGDVYYTYKNLLNDDNKAKNILKQERSSSAVIFYWGMNMIFPQLQLHNIFFSNDYEAEFECIFEKKELYQYPTIYVNITSKLEEQMAPSGMENWFVMVNVPANTGQDWQSLKQQLKQNVIKKINHILGQDIESCIITEQTLDPVLIETQSSSYMGSLYGTSSNSKWAAFLRHANFTGRIKGLYFCGGSVHPGGGIPLCLQSAKIVSELIAEDFKK